MDVALAEERPVLGAAGEAVAQVAVGRGGRLLHHAAHLAGQLQVPVTARQRQALDVEDLAADLRPGQARADAHLQVAAQAVARVTGRSEVVVEVPRPDRLDLPLPLRDVGGDLAAHGADLALQVADARLARVVLDHLKQAGVREADLRGLEAVLLDLPRQQVALGDLQLLEVRVARQLDDLHAVEQRPRDGVQHVGRGDEHHLREIERQRQVVVREVGVLLGIEHLEQRARGIAPEVLPQLVDLVEHEHRVVGAALLQAGDDAAGHRAHVGAPMPADLGLVAHAAQREAEELAPHRFGDAAPQRGLAHAGRARQAQDGPAVVGLQLAHGQVLDDALLDVVQAEMVALEDLLGALQVQDVVRTVRPREVQQPIDVGLAYRVFAGARRHARQAVVLAVRGGQHLLGQFGLVDALAQLVQFDRALVGVAQLALDGLQLLPQVVLALVLVDGLAHARLQLLSQLQDVEFADDQLRQHLQALARRALLEHGLLLGHVDIEVGGDQVGQPARVVDVHGDDLQFVAERLGRVDDLQEVVRHAAHVGQRARIVLDLLLDQLDAGDHVRFLAHELADAAAGDALPQHAHAAIGEAQHLLDLHGRADRVDQVAVGGLAVAVGLDVPLRERAEDLVARQAVVGQPDQVGVGQDQGHHHRREDHGFADRQHRQFPGQPNLVGVLAILVVPVVVRHDVELLPVAVAGVPVPVPLRVLSARSRSAAGRPARPRPCGRSRTGSRRGSARWPRPGPRPR